MYIYIRKDHIVNNELDEDLDVIMKLVVAANTPDELDNATSVLSNKTGLSYEESYLFIKTLRIVLENDYILIDTTIDLIESIVQKLHIKGLLTDEDIKDIKKGKTDDEEN